MNTNKFMRIIVFFDLPVKTKTQRRIATQFRTNLIKDGYHMVQYSVYSRVCFGSDAIDKHMKRLESMKPNNGAARALILTEKQYEGMVILIGKKEEEQEFSPYEQISIF